MFNTTKLIYSIFDSTKQVNQLLNKATESEPVKQEVKCTLTLLPMKWSIDLYIKWPNCIKHASAVVDVIKLFLEEI